MSRIDDAMVEATMRGYDRNNLFAFVAAIVGSDEARQLMEMYRVGTEALARCHCVLANLG